jgi:hypothetical protein
MYAPRFAQRRLCSWLCDIGPCHVCWMRFAVFPQVMVSCVALILPHLLSSIFAVCCRKILECWRSLYHGEGETAPD